MFLANSSKVKMPSSQPTRPTVLPTAPSLPPEGLYPIQRRRLVLPPPSSCATDIQSNPLISSGEIFSEANDPLRDNENFSEKMRISEQNKREKNKKKELKKYLNLEGFGNLQHVKILHSFSQCDDFQIRSLGNARSGICMPASVQYILCQQKGEDFFEWLGKVKNKADLINRVGQHITKDALYMHAEYNKLQNTLNLLKEDTLYNIPQVVQSAIDTNTGEFTMIYINPIDSTYTPPH